jgi:bifunctional DNA-binding transcriptional regulator/antitoxin component of YhaV-PrlF toxin-antitoxin module
MSDAAKALLDDEVALGTEGELVLPARLREALGWREGEPLRARIIGRGTLQVDTIGEDIRKARGMLRAHTGSRSLVDELEGERRREADRE